MNEHLEDSARVGFGPVFAHVRNPEAEGPRPVVRMSLSDSHRALQRAQREYKAAAGTDDPAVYVPARARLEEARFAFFALRRFRPLVAIEAHP